MEVYNLDTLKRFWYIIRPSSIHSDEQDYLEIRLTPYRRFGDYRMYTSYMIELMKLLPNTPVNKQLCFFIKTYEELETIVTFKNGLLCEFFKICYGVNLRYMNKDNKIDGSYNSVKYYRFIFFDIERTDHQDIQDGYGKELLQQYVERVKTNLEKFNLEKPIVIDSGAGCHLLYRIPDTKITDSRKLWLKRFIKNNLKHLNNDIFSIDCIYDATRVLGLPGVLNPKRERLVKLLFADGIYSYWFKLGTTKVKKMQEQCSNNITDTDLPSITDSLEWHILLNNAPKGQRHTILIFALKLLLKAKKIVDVKPYEDVLRKIYGGSINLSQYGTKNKYYNKGIILNWCKKHREWLYNNEKLVEIYEKYLSSKTIKNKDDINGFINNIK